MRWMYLVTDPWWLVEREIMPSCGMPFQAGVRYPTYLKVKGLIWPGSVSGGHQEFLPMAGLLWAEVIIRRGFRKVGSHPGLSFLCRNPSRSPNRPEQSSPLWVWWAPCWCRGGGGWRHNDCRSDGVVGLPHDQSPGMPTPTKFTLAKGWVPRLGKRLWVLRWEFGGYPRKLLFKSAKHACSHAEWEGRTTGGTIEAFAVGGEKRVKTFDAMEGAGSGLRMVGN